MKPDADEVFSDRDWGDMEKREGYIWLSSTPKEDDGACSVALVPGMVRPCAANPEEGGMKHNGGEEERQQRPLSPGALSAAMRLRRGWRRSPQSHRCG